MQEVIEHHHNKGIKTITMGTCLVASSNRPSQEDTDLPTAPNTLRNEIAQELKQSPHPPVASTGEEYSFHQQPSLKQKSLSKQQNLSQQSMKVVESSKGIYRKEKKTDKNIPQVSIQKINRVSLKEVTETNSAHPLEQQSSERGSQSQDSDSVKTEEAIENVAETPFNRKNVEPEETMIEKGLTDDDNKKISISLASNTPIRISQIRLKNMSSYQGQWLQGKRHGQGVLKWQDGSIYKGNWANNCSHGQGKLIYADGGVYEGEFVQNLAQGKGVFTYSNRSKYQGDWKADEPDGEGVMVWEDGQMYDGQWQVGKKHGFGKIEFKDGSYYEGNFHSNEIHGKGHYCWKDSKQYEGQWEHNQMHGKGKLTWTNEDVYEGSFFNGKFQGWGTLTHQDHSSAQGNWEKGRKHGFFNEKDPSGKITQIEWHMGKRARPLIQFNRRQARRLKEQQSKTTSSQQI